MTQKIEFSTLLQKEDAYEIIEALTESIKEGNLHIQRGDESIKLEVPPAVKLTVKAERRKKDAKVSLQLSWPLEDEADAT